VWAGVWLGGMGDYLGCLGGVARGRVTTTKFSRAGTQRLLVWNLHQTGQILVLRCILTNQVVAVLNSSLLAKILLGQCKSIMPIGTGSGATTQGIELR
jgi:hypothetical protein